MNKNYEKALLLMRGNSLKELEKLINSGFNINTQSPWGFTLLHEACVENKNEIVEWLLSKGANIETKTFFGECTPLMIAIRKNNKKIVSMFLDKFKSNSKNYIIITEQILSEANTDDMKILLESVILVDPHKQSYSNNNFSIH